MKRARILFSLLIFTMCFRFISTCFGTSLEERTAELKGGITSEAVLIMENSTGKIVYENNGYQKKYPASTTKIMTAILTIEHCNLSETATASEYAIRSIPSGYSTANIQIGETLSIKDLLYALMLQSANEAAVILAEHVSGSMEAFCDLMNEKANEIGCQNTHFVNPNGVHSKEHYSTAYDLALIAQYAMRNPTFREIVKTTSYTLPATTAYPSDTRTFTNTNALIIYDNRDRLDNYYYEYATGIKTGYTSYAKNCLVSSAEKNGMEYFAVVLGAEVQYAYTGTYSARYVDTISLFDYVFDNFSFKKLKSSNSNVKTVAIDNATKDTKNLNLLIKDDITALVSIDSKDSSVEPNITLKEGLKAPIAKGDVVGQISYEIDGLSYTSDLLAGGNVEEFKPSKILLYVVVFIGLFTAVIYGIRFYNLRKKHLKNRYKYKKNRS